MTSTMSITVYCARCRASIDQTPTDQHQRWIHRDTSTAVCHPGHGADKGVATPDTQRLYDQIAATLDERYTLVDIAYDDRLNPRQIQALLDGENEYESDAFTHTEEWESECRWQASEEILRATVTDQPRTLLDDAGLLDELRMEIADRDDSDVITALLRNSHLALFRYDLRIDVPDYTVLADSSERARAVAEIASAAGVGRHGPRTAGPLIELVEHASYGGRLYVMWHGDPADALTLATPVAYHPDGREVTGAQGCVTFTDAHLIVLDHLNGSGHDVPIEAITATWAPGA